MSQRRLVNKNNSVCLGRSDYHGHTDDSWESPISIRVAVSRAGNFFSPASWKPGRINPSRIRCRSRKQFASVFLSRGASTLLFSERPREQQLQTSSEPGCRVLGVSRWFSWRYPTTISRTAVMCLPCLRLIRVLGSAGPTIRGESFEFVEECNELAEISVSLH